MPYMIHIKEDKGPGIPWRFTEDYLTKGRFDMFNDLCINRWRGNIFTASIFVIRTDTLRNFVEDLFAPNTTSIRKHLSTMKGAHKIAEFVVRAFFILFTALVDLATLPIRCVTLSARCCWNEYFSRENHPLHKYLVSQGADPLLLNRDSLYVSKKQFIMRNDNKFDFTRTEETIDLIGLPDHVGHKYSAGSNCSIMLGRQMSELDRLQKT
jgi:hypothetical protein